MKNRRLADGAKNAAHACTELKQYIEHQPGHGTTSRA
jgi:hypothetical protein